MRYLAPPYMYDVLPYPSVRDAWLHTPKWRFLEKCFRNICRRYGYLEMRTPILEQTDLFTRNIGEATDIVRKEMFSLTTAGGKSLSLKPEGTAPAVRACIEHGLLTEHTPLKLYYIGQNFRYERGQKGRYRQHQQLGVEVFGASHPALDAEVISLAMEFFKQIGISEQRLHVNSVGSPESRGDYLQALRDYIRPFLDRMTEEGRVRFEVNPLRMLDTKNQEELLLLANAPKLTDYMDSSSRASFEQLRHYLETLGIEYIVDSLLVRGFDYYSGTVFEIKGKNLGAQDTLAGGGRYDGLVEACGGPPTPGIGFGLGIERCLLSLESLGLDIPVEDERPQVFLVLPGEESVLRPTAVGLLNLLRSAGLRADMDYTGRSFKSQLKQADSLGSRCKLILGEDELARGVVSIKGLEERKQIEIPMNRIVEELMILLNETDVE